MGGGMPPEPVTRQQLVRAIRWANWYARHGRHAEELVTLLVYLGKKSEKNSPQNAAAAAGGCRQEPTRVVARVPSNGISVAEASARFKITGKLLYQRIWRGRISPICRENNINYYDVADLERILKKPVKARQRKQ